MIVHEPGWYVHLSPSPDLPATDKFGPFDTEADLRDWLREHRVAYHADRIPPRPSVPCWSEMTGDEVMGIWACGIHERKTDVTR